MKDNKPTSIEEILNEILNDVSKFGIDIVRPRLNYYVKEINELRYGIATESATTAQSYIEFLGKPNTNTTY